ncbi:MAG TPA: PhnD/SsuA/transferrin family substrate-binding protein, partial [Elusimicrobiales bacterium]|nr:PhnD/SsuA/transferrin family substrate-binding protein [Elusimicrobiales bacterium]
GPNKPTHKLLLLANRTDNAASLSQLRGAKLFFPQGSGGEDISFLWLDTQLLREGLPLSAEFFKVVKVEDVSKAVLPVFFKRGGVALVTQRAYDNMVELNPQIGQELTVLRTSPELLFTLSLFRKGYEPSWRREVEETIIKKHLSPEGAQVLMLFRTSKIIPFKEEYIASMRELLAEYQRLKTRRAGKGGAVAAKATHQLP